MKKFVLFTINSKSYMMDVPSNLERFFESRMYTLMKMCEFLWFNGRIEKARMPYIESQNHFMNLIDLKNKNSSELKKIIFDEFEINDLCGKTYREYIEIIEAL